MNSGIDASPVTAPSSTQDSASILQVLVDQDSKGCASRNVWNELWVMNCIHNS